MNETEKRVEDLRDGQVFFAPDNELIYRVHRSRQVSCFGQPWVELIVRNVDHPQSSLIALLYERGRRVPLSLSGEK